MRRALSGGRCPGMKARCRFWSRQLGAMTASSPDGTGWSSGVFPQSVCENGQSRQSDLMGTAENCMLVLKIGGGFPCGDSGQRLSI